MFIAILGAFSPECRRSEVFQVLNDITGDKSIRYVRIDAERRDQYSPWILRDTKLFNQFKSDIERGADGIIIHLQQFPRHVFTSLQRTCRRRTVQIHEAPQDVSSLEDLKDWLDKRWDVLPRRDVQQPHPPKWEVSEERAVIIGILCCLIKERQFMDPDSQGHGGVDRGYFPRNRPLNSLRRICPSANWEQILDKMASVGLLVIHNRNQFNISTRHRAAVLQCIAGQDLKVLHDLPQLSSLFTGTGINEEEDLIDVARFIDESVREFCGLRETESDSEEPG